MINWETFKIELKHLSLEECERVERAFRLGEKVHAGQKRASGEPYFSHPIAVARILIGMNADADTIIAALLHDAVEDTPTTIDDVREQFGDHVAELIDGVTKIVASDVAHSPRLDERIETLRKIFTLLQKDVRIMVIKLADRLHNMQTARFISPEKQKTLAEETSEVYVKIADRLCMQDMEYELQGLCFEILHPDLHQKLVQLREKNTQIAERIIPEMREKLTERFPDFDASLQLEFKRWDSLEEQLRMENGTVTGVATFTLVVVCEDIAACYKKLGRLHQIWQREALSFQDYINAPAINGYKGLHTTLLLPRNIRVRCKIRTQEMHEYAHRGITLMCFDEKSIGVAEYLPWTARIASLTSDSGQFSRDFWASLQSDILGESILIHGPGGDSVLLPTGSTALDGAFFYFQDKALRLHSVNVNGRIVAFSQRLQYGDSLDIELATRSTASHEWLEWVRTGFASAKIRTALTEESEQKKLFIGKKLLSDLMSKRQAGFIEEFDRHSLGKRIKEKGYGSIEEIYIAIADGRTTALEMFKELFGENAGQSLRFLPKRVAPACIVRFSIKNQDPEVTHRIMDLFRHYDVGHRGELRIVPQPDEEMSVFSMRLRLNEDEQERIKRDIEQLGAGNIAVMVNTLQERLLMGTVIFLWALNPVFARWFYLQGITPLALITIRSLSFCVFSTLVYLGWKVFVRGRYSNAPKLARQSLIPALGLNGMTFFNYFALVFVPPSVHLLLMRLNALILPFFGESKIRSRKISLVFVLLLFGSIALLIMTPGDPFIFGIGLSLAAMVSYTGYSLSTERILHHQKIDIRYPLFLFYLGLGLGIVGLILLPFQSMASLVNGQTIPIVIYVLTCVFIPHVCYAVMLKNLKFSYFTDLMLLEVPLAVIMEIALLQTVLNTWEYVSVTLVLLVLLMQRRLRRA